MESSTDRISNFLKECKSQSKPVAFITSAGTSIPLEKNTVRSIENFSTGKRGAISAEYFLKMGFAVIFLHRKNSLQPFKVRVDLNR
jgi:phosphopantothenate---cysteine ligase (ATP)